MKGTPAQMIDAARRSIRAARVLLDEELPDQAASRAYYAMFYVASALLKKEGLEFSSHSAVHAAFGRELANPDRVPRDMHRWLLDAFVFRTAADYDTEHDMTAAIVTEMIRQAEEFVKVGEDMISR